METKNKRKSNLKLLILLLLLTAVLLIASTYAWFTANQTVTVSDLTVNVETKNGLQISVDGTNWKSVIQTADITGASTTYPSAINQLPSTLEAVSTGGNVTDGLLEMFYGQVDTKDGDYILTASKDAEANGTTGRFIAFDLFFQVNQATPIYLTPTSGVTSAENKGIENTARIAFLVQGHSDPGTPTATIQGLKGATNATTYIWEPNYDTHTASGVQNANDVYGVTTQTEGATQLPYEGVKAAITKDDSVLLGNADSTNFADLFQTVTPTYSTTKAFSTNVPLTEMTLQPGVTKVRIYMWIEGQDVDCENNASGTSAVFNLQITSNNA